MERIWQWAWDRYGARYSWAIWVGVFASTLPPYLLWSFLVVAFEKSSHYVEATVVTVVAVVVMSLVVVLPGSRRFHGGRRAMRSTAQKHCKTRTPGLVRWVFERCGSSLFGPHCC
jgi:hypothetical protein